jgi:hypothetical protein
VNNEYPVTFWKCASPYVGRIGASDGDGGSVFFGGKVPHQAFEVKSIGTAIGWLFHCCLLLAKIVKKQSAVNYFDTEQFQTIRVGRSERESVIILLEIIKAERRILII